MKTKIISVTAVALALLSTQSAHAQSGVAFEANVAKAFDVTGAEPNSVVYNDAVQDLLIWGK